jgi:hypothetical protein
MLIKNVSKKDLDKALMWVNKKYSNNITWNNFEQVNKKGDRFRVTLKVKDSHKNGARLGSCVTHLGNRRHLINACWHVHGNFFDALLVINNKAIIKTAGRTIDINNGNWEDWNIGSVMEPFYYSEACECF